MLLLCNIICERRIYEYDVEYKGFEFHLNYLHAWFVFFFICVCVCMCVCYSARVSVCVHTCLSNVFLSLDIVRLTSKILEVTETAGQPKWTRVRLMTFSYKLYIYIYIYIYICVCVCVYIYICINIYIYMSYF